jgi:hypothetical protein
MSNNITKSPAVQSEADTAVHLLDDWFDPIEAGLRDRVRELIQAMIEGELEAVLCRRRYVRRQTADPESTDGPSGITGHRHGHRSRSLLGTFGRVRRDNQDERPYCLTRECSRAIELCLIKSAPVASSRSARIRAPFPAF